MTPESTMKRMPPMYGEETIPLDTLTPQELLTWLDAYYQLTQQAFGFVSRNAGRWESFAQMNQASEQCSWYSDRLAETEKHIIMRMNAWNKS